MDHLLIITLVLGAAVFIEACIIACLMAAWMRRDKGKGQTGRAKQLIRGNNPGGWADVHEWERRMNHHWDVMEKMRKREIEKNRIKPGTAAGVQGIDRAEYRPDAKA